ncbi:MAG: gliding motility-associated C-terminal domain-containing protein [Bacteroidetes bacterium]|nr:gliding motility-associated C-terminal domain-containing protein [Bacteroidota bacterium]
MKKSFLYYFFLLNLFFLSEIHAQVPAPELRCVSVTGSNTAVLSWITPPDPSNLFTEYQIWRSPTGTGYTLVGTVNVYGQTSYTDTPSPVGNQSMYYYVTTVSGAGTSTSVPSYTLRTIAVNISGSSVNGISSLNWNAVNSPILPSSSPTYTVSREAPSGTWTPIYTGSQLSYKDTIYRCKIFYNYKVEISDNLGCISQSNIKGDTCYNKQPPNTLVIDSVSVDANGHAVLGWPASPSKDVTCYVIYTSGGGFLTGIDTICGYNNTTYTVSGSSAGTGSEGYCVVARDSCGNYSIPSLTSKTIFLNTPTYDLCSRTASLTWTSYTNLVKGVLRYDIYCSVNGGAAGLVGSTTGNSFAHDSLIPGTTYCYVIRVWNTDLSISASSNKQCFTATGLPGPAFAYINSVSVNTSNKQMEITYTIDYSNPSKGCNLYKSEDGITFTRLAYIPFTTTVVPQTYIDRDVKTTEKNYYYRIQAMDDCNNPGVWSDTSKSVVLHVSNDHDNIFYNTLTWDDYMTWGGGVSSFNIYRAVNGVFDPTPISNVPVGTRTYIDDVQNYVSDQGKFSYYVEAVEGAGNSHGFMDKAKSNPADAYVEVTVFVPNAFAPRGINNVWLPVAQYVEKTDYKVMVFNRWGDKIFETHSDTEGWTGNAATDEVYVYLIEYKNARGEFIQLKGHVNIIR